MKFLWLNIFYFLLMFSFLFVARIKNQLTFYHSQHSNYNAD